MLLRLLLIMYHQYLGKINLQRLQTVLGVVRKVSYWLDNSLRDVGDGVLHTHSKKEILISVNQIRFEPEFDIILSEIILSYRFSNFRDDCWYVKLRTLLPKPG